MAFTYYPLAIVLVIGLSLAQISWAVVPSFKGIEYIVPHNLARSKERMPPIVWNDTVAAYAKSYAQVRAVDCALQHSYSELYGENIAMSTGDLSPAQAIDLWVSEKPDYDYTSNSCTEGKMCGHYTQIVWKSTKSIGCASARCQNGGTFITCNYYPPGSYIGERPF